MYTSNYIKTTLLARSGFPGALRNANGVLGLSVTQMESQASAPTAAPAASPLSVPKPDHPRKPAKPDLRTGSDEAKAARQQEYDAAMAKYSLAKAEYDDVLYPAYRAAQKKAARPADDGAQAVQRRRNNPVAAANHKQREALRQAEIEAIDEQVRFLAVCQDAIGCVLTFDGSDYVRLYNACDKPMLRAVLQWVTESPPDGS